MHTAGAVWVACSRCRCTQQVQCRLDSGCAAERAQPSTAPRTPAAPLRLRGGAARRGRARGCGSRCWRRRRWGGSGRARPMARPPAPPGAPRCFGALSTGQLRALLQDEPRLQRAVRLSKKFQALQREREERLAANSALARDNLALRPRLEDGKAALAIKYQELREVREACRAKLRRLGECGATGECGASRRGKRPSCREGGTREGRFPAAPHCPRTETYLEECGPQRALDRLRAALDASEAEAEVSGGEPEAGESSAPCPAVCGAPRDSAGLGDTGGPRPCSALPDAPSLPVPQEQMQRFLAHEVPLDVFLESFCRSRARFHVSRTQLEKLQELLQRGRDSAEEPQGLNPASGHGAASPKALQLRCGFVPAVLVPAAAVVPFAVPPKHRLPALGQPPPAPQAAPLSPRPIRRREPEPLQP
uniref:VPS37D subunit of ESCRT-I n=1 Tax=Coturnix japonica TaxID=93934 RepID=A0A8C2SXC1_COTJA